MPEREQRIAQWRRELVQALGSESDILDELESHLREEIDRLLQQGQPLGAALDLAMARLGSPAMLAGEFAKSTQPWWPIRVWGGLVLLVLLASLVLIGSSLRFANQPVLLVHVAAVTLGYGLSYGIGGLAILYAVRRMAGDLPRGQRNYWLNILRRTTVSALLSTTVGVMLGALWAADRLGRAWDWDPRETGGFAVIVWLALLLLWSWRLARQVRWLLCLGMLGNLVVTFAWFITPFLPSQLHSYGHSWTLVLTASCVLTFSHLLLMAGTVAPSGWLCWKKATQP